MDLTGNNEAMDTGILREDKGKEMSELERTKQMLKKTWERRKIRIDLASPKASSAPTSPVGNVGSFNFVWDEVKARSFKRRREEEQEGLSTEEARERESKLAYMTRQLILGINDEIKVVAKMAEERNTKKGIKEAAAKLTSKMSRLMTTEVQNLLLTLGKYPDTQGRCGEQQCLEEEVMDLKRKVERLQDENRRIKGELKTLTQRKGVETNNRVTEEQIDGVKSYHDLVKLRECYWPNQVFKAAHMAKGDLLNVSKDADFVLLTEDKNDDATNEDINKEIINRFPELGSMVGKLTMMTVETKVEDISGHREIGDRIVFKAELEEEQEDWFNVMTKIRDKMTVRDRTKLAIQPLPKDAKGTQLRRIVECVFRHTGIKCIIATKEEEQTKKPKTGRTRNQNTEALVIKQEGKTYSELLKTVKGKVTPGTKVADAIKVVRKTKDGNLIIIMNKDNSETIKELKAGIEGAASNIDVRAIRTNGTVFIKDIDGETTREDVVNAIERETGIGKDQFEVSDLRPYFGGNQAATVRIDKSKMPHLLAKERIRIGLNNCNVTERINVNQCFRCWGFGHRRESCKGEDRSAACRRCGEANHLARDCSKDMFCINCNREGHSAGTGRCPEFRKAISRAKRLEKAKKSY